MNAHLTFIYKTLSCKLSIAHYSILVVTQHCIILIYNQAIILCYYCVLVAFHNLQ